MGNKVIVENLKNLNEFRDLLLANSCRSYILYVIILLE